MPEVETVRRALQRYAVGRKIENVSFTNPKVLKGQSEAEFRERAVGKRIADVTRRGKYLFAPLVATEPSPFPPPYAASLQLCIHLKMRGQLLWSDAISAIDPYLCVSLDLDEGWRLRFHDSWGWGEIRVLTEREIEQKTAVTGFGAEPLAEQWNADWLAKRLSGRRIAVKAALLDQRVAAGVGNIYADEALFRAKVHPQRMCDSLSWAEIVRLVGSVKVVLEDAVQQGGSSGDFRSVDGEVGSYVPQAYDRAGENCPRCAKTFVRIRVAGRGTVYCPQCQEEKRDGLADIGPEKESYGSRRPECAGE